MNAIIAYKALASRGDWNCMTELRSMRRAALAFLFSVLAITVIATVWRLAVRPPPCTAPLGAPLVALVGLEPLFGGANFDKPVQMLAHPSERDVFYVVRNEGVVERVAAAQSPRREIVLDIRDRVLLGPQWGLQAIALHPGFPDEGRVFVSYVGHDNVSTVAAFHTRLDGQHAVPEAEIVLFREAQEVPWHPIGGLAFGPDGYLYVAWGYGHVDSADPRYLRGKLLRIDVDRSDGAKPYAIPADNPFIGTDFDAAVYAIGFRNPWRFSFHHETGELWLGDVGEAGYEEIDRVAAGRDYGWPAWEGTACRRPAECAKRSSEPPVQQHSHGEMCGAIGGYFYRGRAIPSLRGRYVYGDACTGTLWAFEATSEPATSEAIAHTGIHLASFAEDADGELYVVSSAGFDEEGNSDTTFGGIWKVVAADTGETAAVASAPKTLAELGCVAGNPPGTGAPGATIEYAINHPLWEDGAEVRRFMTTKRTEQRSGVEEAFAPPVGSVVMKTYLSEGRPTQTQLLARRDDGLWDAYLYEWSDDGADAVPNAAAASGCARCHNLRAGMLRGLTISQLNREFRGENQIELLERIGTIDWPWKGRPLPVMPRVQDEEVDIERRARAYLDVNCAACHQPGGETGAASFDLRFATPWAMTGLCGTAASATIDGVAAARLIEPGAPEESMLSVRMHRTDLAAMPPGRLSVDSEGTRVVDAWIGSLVSCPSGGE